MQYLGTGRIFVNTADLSRIIPDGVDLFKSHMNRKKILPDWLYFKGDKGFQIAPDGSRVLICKSNGRRRRVPFKMLRVCNS
jgi:hypothetical protein